MHYRIALLSPEYTDWSTHDETEEAYVLGGNFCNEFCQYLNDGGNTSNCNLIPHYHIEKFLYIPWKHSVFFTWIIKMYLHLHVTPRH